MSSDMPDDLIEAVDPMGTEETALVEAVVTGSPDTGSLGAATAPVPAPALRQRPTMLLAALLLVSAVVAGSVYWWLYRPDQMVGEGAQQQVLAAARSGTEALLSYGPDTLDNDLASAKSHLTGNFLEHYTTFTNDVVIPAARERGVKTEASVGRAGVSEMKPDQAQVLVFVNQVTTSKGRPTPALATSSVVVTLVRSGDTWLISEFNPV